MTTHGVFRLQLNGEKTRFYVGPVRARLFTLRNEGKPCQNTFDSSGVLTPEVFEIEFQSCGDLASNPRGASADSQ